MNLIALRAAGIAGVIGAIFWTLGDGLIVGVKAAAEDYRLLFQTYANQIKPELAAVTVPASQARLAAGALVADVGIVFYLVGSWHLFRGLLPAGGKWAWPIFVLLICGNAWSPLGHAAFYYLGMAYKTVLVTPPEAHQAVLDLAVHFQDLLLIAWLIPIVTLGLALLGLGITIALGQTAWPRWFALIANPVSLVAIGVAIPLALPEPLQTWLAGAVFNIGWFVIYLTSSVLLWNGGRANAR